MAKPSSVRARWKNSELRVAKHFGVSRNVHGRGIAGDTDTDVIVELADYGVPGYSKYLFVEVKYSFGTEHVVTRRYEDAGKPDLAIWDGFIVLNLDDVNSDFFTSAWCGFLDDSPRIESKCPALIKNALTQCERSCDEHGNATPMVVFNCSRPYRLAFLPIISI